jgi:dTDP-4-amino-4,6-dideoxygalactose transaminase
LNGVKHAIGVGSGTDALFLSLKAFPGVCVHLLRVRGSVIFRIVPAITAAVSASKTGAETTSKSTPYRGPKPSARSQTPAGASISRRTSSITARHFNSLFSWFCC